MLNPNNYMWTERYRPKKVSELVGDFRDKIMKYLENQQALPHFLLYSKVPGTGKTSLAKAIINELGCDALILNSSDDRKIDAIRDKVKEFSMTQSTIKGQRRCVFLDEFDGMLKACVSSDTLCLTSNGWKKYNQLIIGEKIASYNTETDIIEFKPLKYIHKYKVNEKLYRLKAYRVDLLTTREHRNFIVTRQGKKKFRTSEDLGYYDRIFIAGKKMIIENTISIGEDMAELIGWIVSEGTMIKCKKEKVTHFRIYQNEGKYSDRIDYLLKKLKIPYKKTNGHHGRYKQKTWYLKRCDVTDKIINLIPKKELNDLVLKITDNEAKCLFRSLIQGDGHIHKYQKNAYTFFQKNKNTCDWFEILALRLGYSVSSKTRQGNNNNIACLPNKTSNIKITKENYSGIVWCPEVENHTWIAKRNGKVCITGNSQEALRNVMETYVNNVFFILTCNNINKVIMPLQSRCVKIPFAHPNKDEIAIYLKGICAAENMTVTDDGIAQLIEKNYPSIRNCVLTLQDLHTEGLDITAENVKPTNDMYDGLWQKLLEKDWKYIKKVVLKSTIDPRDLNSFFWEKALYSEPVMLKVVQLCCRNEKDIAWGADAKIVLVTSLIEMCK